MLHNIQLYLPELPPKRQNMIFSLGELPTLGTCIILQRLLHVYFRSADFGRLPSAGEANLEKFYCGSSGRLAKLPSLSPQYTEERLGQADVTELDPQAEELLAKIDRIQMWTEKIVKNADCVLQPNPGKDAEDPKNKTSRTTRRLWHLCYLVRV